MNVNYCSSPCGILTYYNDTNLYNTMLAAFGSGSQTYDLIRNGQQAEDYDLFMQIFPTATLFSSLQSRGPDITLAMNNLLLTIFPNTTVQMNVPGQTYRFYNNEDHFVKTQTTEKETYLYDGTTDLIGYNGANTNGLFYGYIDVYTSDDETSREAMLPIIIFNDDFSGFLIFAVTAIHYEGTYSEVRFRRGGLYTPGTDTAFKEFFESMVADPVPDNDPYADGGASGRGGGTGTFSDTGDMIGIPALPSLSAVDAGFITLFNPSIAELASLASYMWTGAFDLNTFRKIFADPMDCILGLSIVPVNVPAGGSAEVQVGNIGTGVYMTTAARQYVEVDCGTLNVQEFWGGYLDYDPYTKAEIYLPYIGTHPIAVDDIMGKPVHVVYHLDILSGACIAYVQCGGSVLYSFIGQCSSSIPITGNDWTNVVNGVLSIAGSIGSMVATGGASAPTAVASIASTAINTMKPSVEKSGSLSGTGGMLGVQVPYLILTRPRQARPARQNTFIGYPSFITEDMGTLRGYTEIESVHLEGIPATPGEIDEIESILKGGVIF